MDGCTSMQGLAACATRLHYLLPHPQLFIPKTPNQKFRGSALHHAVALLIMTVRLIYGELPHGVRLCASISLWRLLRNPKP